MTERARRPSPRVLIGCIALISAAGTARAQASASRLVPIVLDVAGVGSSHYTTELTLSNRGTTPASVSLTYTPATSLGATGGGTATLALAAGRQLVEPDVVAYLRGQGLAIPTGSNQGGTLLASFTGLSSADAAFVGARTTTASGPGRAGLAYAGVDPASAETGTSYLYGLRSTPNDRTNLALVNASPSTPITLRVTLYSGIAGDSRTFTLADTTLDAGQWVQIGRVLDPAGFTNGYARIEIVSGTGPYVAYAVFNDNTTNDGSYVEAERASPPAETLFLPVLVETGTFQSELVLTNPVMTAQTAVLNYVESASPGSGAGGSLTLSFQPGEQKIIAGAIDFFRQRGIPIGPKGSGTYAGALSVTFTSGASVSTGFVGARTAAPVDGTGPGEYGVFYPGIGASSAALTEAWVYGLQQNGANRSNLAVVNLGDSGDPITVRVDVYDGDTGQLAGSATPAPLAPGGWTQINAVLQSFNVSDGYVHVVKLSGNDHFLAYGVVDDGSAPGQGTSDGSYVAGLPVFGWTQKSPTASPSARYDHGVAYDSARGQLVLFGGIDENFDLLADTWVWDGADWTQKFPETSPPARYQHAMAYDAARGTVVLFGGATLSNGTEIGLRDTWTWDGNNWTQQSPMDSPPTREDPVMAFDAARAQIVLFGGVVGGNGACLTPFNDTWVWDGNDWTQQSPETSPPGRWDFTMAYDSVHAQMVLFGGAIGQCSAQSTQIANDTWVWDGATWTQKLPDTSPSERLGAAMAFDAVRGQVVLFGGATGSSFLTELGDTWLWDGSGWTQDVQAGPPARHYHRMATDSARGQIVLFGGVGHQYFSDTWTRP